MAKLDESLITSEVCVKCGSCCKMTTDRIRCSKYGLPWYEVVVEQNDLIRLVDFNEKEESIKIRFTCPKLVVDEQQKTFMCSIYPTRPDVCANYNCFRNANNRNIRPQRWDYIKGIIKEVHGVDVTWDGPLSTDGSV